MEPKDLCMGGYAEGGEVDDGSDAILDQCASECMDAIEKKDKAAFIEALHYLVADLLSKLSSEPKTKE